MRDIIFRIMDEKIVKVTDRLRGLCSRREYCVSDVMAKAVKALDGDRSAAEKVVAALVEDKYVDDLRYASAFARDKSGIQGWGATKIRYMLSGKGVAKDIIDSALEEIDDSKASDRLQKLIENKYRSLKDDPQWKLKLLRFGLGRGYSYDELNAVIKTLCRSES